MSSLRLPLRDGRRLLRRVLLVFFLLAAIGAGTSVLGLYVWAGRQLAAGRTELLRRHGDEARYHLAHALWVWPHDAEVRLLAARASRLAGLFDAAEEHLNACRKAAGPTEALALERALLRAHRGQLDPALENFLQSAIAARHPETSFILEAWGHGCCQALRYPQAFLCFEAWRTREPELAEPWVQLGLLWEQKEQAEQAENHYLRAVELDPEHFEARLRLAQVQLGRGKPAEAAAHFAWLQRQRPTHAGALLGLAKARLMQGQTEAGRQLLDRVLVLDPVATAALLERGRVALQENELARAEAFLRQALEQDPFFGPAYYQLSLCLSSQGREQEARDCLARSKALEAAVRRLYEARLRLAAAPDDPGPRCESGLILLELGMNQEGLRWLQSALREAPNHAPTHRALATYYERIGEADKAAYHRLRAGLREGAGKMGTTVK